MTDHTVCPQCYDPFPTADHECKQLIESWICSFCNVRLDTAAKYANHIELCWAREKADNFNAVKDSGKREQWDTGSRRDTREGKGRYDLIPAYPMRRLARHYENGAVKYGDRNWEKGQPLSRYLDSAERHLYAVKEGLTDEDHAIAVVWNMFAFIHTQEMVRRGKLPALLDDVSDDQSRVIEADE